MSERHLSMLAIRPEELAVLAIEVDPVAGVPVL